MRICGTISLPEKQKTDVHVLIFTSYLQHTNSSLTPKYLYSWHQNTQHTHQPPLTLIKYVKTPPLMFYQSIGATFLHVRDASEGILDLLDDDIVVGLELAGGLLGVLELGLLALLDADA
jgi:hypothetical protein